MVITQNNKYLSNYLLDEQFTVVEKVTPFSIDLCTEQTDFICDYELRIAAMNRILISIGIISVITILSCSSGEKTLQFPFGGYYFKSYNFLGDLVGEGTIYFGKSDSVHITGNWSIRDIHNCMNCGPQFGSGYLTGQMKDDSLFINLNPDNPENRTELAGRISKGKFNGEWKWVSTTGFGNKGSFKAAHF